MEGTKENIHKGIYAKRKRNKVPGSKKQSDLKHQREEHHRKQTEEALDPREKGDQVYEDNINQAYKKMSGEEKENTGEPIQVSNSIRSKLPRV